MKIVYTWLVLSLGLTMPLFGQTLAEWPLDDLNHEQPTNVASDFLASDFQRGNGISAITFSSDGAKAASWSDFESSEPVDYYQICVEATNGRTAEITGIQYEERRTADGARAYELYYSTDGFATSTRLDSIGLPDNTSWRGHSSAMNMKLKPGEQLCYRWYAYDTESPGGEWEIRANTLELTGSVMAPCAAPDAQGTVTPNNVGPTSMQLQLGPGGNGTARIVFMREGAPVEAVPCQGDVYAANHQFGAGQLVGEDTYVVSITAATNANIFVNGLQQGTDYYVAVYEYSNLCYQTTAVTANATTDCYTAVPVSRHESAPLDGRVALMWDNPGCAETVLVVAGQSPITGSPSGDGSQYTVDATFGQGQATPDFGANVYPVFLGNGNQVTVDGLSNGANYYFTLFTRLNGVWSLPYALQESPVSGCSELGGDHLFVNEIHHVNTGPVDQDEGVEIAGRAGTDLSLYELYIYRRPGNPSDDSGYVEHVIPLSGTIDDESNGRGAVWVPVPDMPNTSAGIVIYNRVSEEVVQFMSYRHDVLAVDGPAAGMFVDAATYGDGVGLYGNISEISTPAGVSLQLFGEGDCPDDFGWGRAPATRYSMNGNQSFLPVELVSFQAKAVGPDVRLNWQTANEQNSAYFTVEHSTDARQFTVIGEVAAAGQSSTLRDYELWDYKPAPGLNYYRLQQVDFDGTVHDQGVVVVRFDDQRDGPTVEVFPNPTTDQVTVFWSSEATALWLFDANGRPVRQQPLGGEAGSLSVPMSDLPAGLYLLRLDTPAGVETLRVVKR